MQTWILSLSTRTIVCAVFSVASMLAACDTDSGRQKEPKQQDPHVVRDDTKHDPQRNVVSPVALQAPIYACAKTAVVHGYAPNAKVSLLVNGTAVASNSSPSTLHLTITAPADFVAGDKITAVQDIDGFTSPPSNEVTVISHTEDYPVGLPQPQLHPPPLLACGRAVGVKNVVPGAWVKVITENPKAGGGFDPPVELGETRDFPYVTIGSAFIEAARVHAESGLCTDRSPHSPVETVQAAPGSLPAPVVDPIPPSAQIVVVRGPPSGELAHGATLDIFSTIQPAPGRVGGQPTMGGNVAQQVGISPAATTGHHNATQSLCSVTSPPSVNVPVMACSDLPAPIIRPPLPGESFIEVIQAEADARILVYASDGEIGDSGGSPIILTRPLVSGETITVQQQVGDCIGTWVYRVRVECSAEAGPSGCTADWPMFRQNALRNAQQAHNSVLANPAAVKNLRVRWQFRPSGGIAFRASPVIFGNRVFIGNGNGRLYALDAATGAQLWQYPPATQPALTSQYQSNQSSFGIASSAAIARSRERDLVIFAAPDQSIGARLGSGRLFALDPVTGAEVWKSPEIAVLNGTDRGSVNERHEQIGYSSPLVFNNRVYVGIANHGDNPIQNGRVAAVDVHTGTLVNSFSFVSTGNRGGGIWSSVAGGLPGGGLYATTGNTRSHCDGCDSEPSPNHGLSLLRLDAGNGALAWKLQPVPFDADNDPDWASGPALVDASCGPVAVSTMKDGWAYAANVSPPKPPAPSVRWQFPATGWPFSAGDGTVHGDSRYLIPGAAWGQVFLTTSGGEATTTALDQGFRRIHALNICGGPRVRWVADIPGLAATDYQLGPPTATRGITFVGTAQGHLVAIADPSVYATANSRCSNPQVAPNDCIANGFHFAPVPKILLDLDLNTMSSGDAIFTEPALAGGRVFVATSSGAGTLYMLEPQ